MNEKILYWYNNHSGLPAISFIQQSTSGYQAMVNSIQAYPHIVAGETRTDTTNLQEVVQCRLLPISGHVRIGMVSSFCTFVLS